MFDINEIKDVIPHRYPMLLVDKIVELEAGEKVVGIKNVTINEEFFQGHYPDHPIMPGVLILESMAQVSGFLMKNTFDNPEEKIPFFAGIDKAKFRKPVIPGDQLRIESKILRSRKSIAKVSAKAFVGEKLAAEAELLFAIQDK